MFFNTKKWFKISNLIVIIVVPLLLGVACHKSSVTKKVDKNSLGVTAQEIVAESELDNSQVVFPIIGYVEKRVKQVYGQYVTEPVEGYHTGDDVEVNQSQKDDIPIASVADGEIIYKKWTANYGGLVVIKHLIDQNELKIFYGHLRLASISKNVGDKVTKGEIIGMLGADRSYDTDNQRRHLHFGIYQGSDINLSVAVSKPEQLVNWLNPTDFFQKYNLPTSVLGELTFTSVEPMADFKLSFKYPAFWQAEYWPSEKLINLFSLQGGGSGLERSQVIIYQLTADNFQVPERFEILEQKNSTYAGQASIDYQVTIRDNDDILLKMPSWISLKHRLTVIKNQEVNKRYYVLEQNPELPIEQFEQFLSSLSFSKTK